MPAAKGSARTPLGPRFLERKRPAISEVVLPCINIAPDISKLSKPKLSISKTILTSYSSKSKELVTVILPPKDPPQPTTDPPQQVEDLPQPAENLPHTSEDNVLTKEMFFEMIEDFNKESLNQLKNILKQP
jgi:hypothetical protein